MEKHCCYEWSFTGNGTKKAEDCDGVLYTTGVYDRPEYEEGFYVQVCPRASKLGQRAGGVVFCGNGSDVVIIHQADIPTIEQVNQAVDDFIYDY